jgi:hypothetical protein
MFLLGASSGIPVSYVAYVLLRREFDRPPVAGQTAALITYVVTGLGLLTGAILL